MAAQAPNTSKQLLERNATYSKDHKPFYHYTAENFVSTFRMIIVSCMDQRVIPEQFCGLEAGQIPVIRCSGGRAKFAINDIALLNTLIGINEIVIVHHTDCGLTHITDDQVRTKVEALSAEEAAKIDFANVAITSFDESLRFDIDWLRSHPLIKKDTIITGFLYDIDTGSLDKVNV